MDLTAHSDRISALRTPKQPVQQRSIERVEAMLDAAERLVAVHGMSGVTINMIADESGINRASIYQFFPSILAVWRGLALRYLSDLQEVFEGVLREREFRHWLDASEALVDAAVEYYNSHPVPRSVLLGTDGNHDLRLADPDYDRRYAEWISENFRDLAGDERAMGVKFLRVSVTVTTSIFSLSVWEHGRITDFYAGEVKRITRAYRERLAQDFDRRRDQPERD